MAPTGPVAPMDNTRMARMAILVYMRSIESSDVVIYMYVYVCICMYIQWCVYVCMYICICICTYMYTCIYVCMYISYSVHVCICMYMYVYVCTLIYVCMYVYICMMCTCMYVCVCIYMRTSISSPLVRKLIIFLSGSWAPALRASTKWVNFAVWRQQNWRSEICHRGRHTLELTETSRQFRCLAAKLSSDLEAIVGAAAERWSSRILKILEDSEHPRRFGQELFSGTHNARVARVVGSRIGGILDSLALGGRRGSSRIIWYCGILEDLWSSRILSFQCSKPWRPRSSFSSISWDRSARRTATAVRSARLPLECCRLCSVPGT